MLKTKVEVLEELKKNNSINYKGYLQMLLLHFEKYGETPKHETCKFCTWNQNDSIKEEIKKTKIFCNVNDYTIVTEKGIIYEVSNGTWSNEVIRILDNKAYENYDLPMPYNMYIVG